MARSNPKISYFDNTVTLLLGQGQRSGSRSRSNSWRTAVDIRGSALPSAAKDKEESLSVRGVCLCVE